MSNDKNIDYGPLNELIGVWTGDKGLDIAPEPDGAEENPYFETITFTAIGDVTNAESQVLAALHYHQIVQRKSNSEVFHNETGYWMWDSQAAIIMHSLAIPRAVCVLAGGTYAGAKDANGRVVIEVSASSDEDDWTIIESPFMRDNARTTRFSHKITVGDGSLSYAETTMV
ncbi:MAG: FABP family protein, partial [Candidatus Marinimicrobia bacterium]|nr:FABP family protein [Candidatus Neomarinimicrobiota bacterium]